MDCARCKEIIETSFILECYNLCEWCYEDWINNDHNNASLQDYIDEPEIQQMVMKYGGF